MKLSHVLLFTIFVAGCNSSNIKPAPRDKDTADNKGLCGNEADKYYKAVSKAFPKYPRIALLDSQEGWGLVAYTIYPNGWVGEVEILDSSPAEVFDLVMIQAAKKFKYKPIVKNPPEYRACDLLRMILH